MLKFNKFLVKAGDNEIIFGGPHNFIYAFSDTVGEGHGSNREKAVINISLGRTYNISDPNKAKWLSHGILAGLVWGFLTLLDVGAALLQDILLPVTTWFKIHEYCNRLYCFFTTTAFALTVHVLEKNGRIFFLLNMRVWA